MIINVGSVVGIVPIVGVPLPLVSAGGSALVMTMLAIGVVLSFARTEPGAKEALAARGSVVRKTLAVVGRTRGSRTASDTGAKPAGPGRKRADRAEERSEERRVGRGCR